MSKMTDFVAIRYVFLSFKYTKTRFRPGLRPGPRWGSLRRSHRPPSRLGRGHPFPIPFPLDAFGISIGCQAPRPRHKFLATPYAYGFGRTKNFGVAPPMPVEDRKHIRENVIKTKRKHFIRECATRHGKYNRL